MKLFAYLIFLNKRSKTLISYNNTYILFCLYLECFYKYTLFLRVQISLFYLNYMYDNHYHINLSMKIDINDIIVTSQFLNNTKLSILNILVDFRVKWEMSFLCAKE